MTGSLTSEKEAFEAVRDRLFQLRCRSKKGEHLSPEDIDFLESCWKRWPKEYEAMGRAVFDATAPFGSLR